MDDDTLLDTTARTETSPECRDLVSAVQYLSFQVHSINLHLGPIVTHAILLWYTTFDCII